MDRNAHRQLSEQKLNQLLTRATGQWKVKNCFKLPRHFSYISLVCLAFVVLCTLIVQHQRISINLSSASHENDSNQRKRQCLYAHVSIPASSSKWQGTSSLQIDSLQSLAQRESLSDYECVAWRQTDNCLPYGPPIPRNDKSCDAFLKNGNSGYCEIRHRSTGTIERVLHMHCDTLRRGNVKVKCSQFQEYLTYGPLSIRYIHDTYNNSFRRCNSTDIDETLTPPEYFISLLGNRRPNANSFGISIVMYEKILLSVYASVRSLRSMGCNLPIELWYLYKEINIDRNPIIEKIKLLSGITLRQIQDSRMKRYYTKIYAVYHSNFNRVLLLDADNFAVRDPTYLFHSPEFIKNGAIFWPDFWHPQNTIFNIQPSSLVWDIFDLDYVSMFEQESGQVLIDRCRHQRALNVLMYYAVHHKLLEATAVVHGDKDLFRFAWLKTKSNFYMIQRPPGAAGLQSINRKLFCGVTIVQYDSNDEILFLHRNQEKLYDDNVRVIWSHIQEYCPPKTHNRFTDYMIRGANAGKFYPQFKRCFGKDSRFDALFSVRPILDFQFAELEYRLLQYITEALNATKII